MNHATLVHWVWTTLAALAPATVGAQPYPSSTVISDLQFDFSKYTKRASGSDNWALTWAANDHQYASWGDGFGFDGGTSKVSLGYSRIEGPKVGWTARDVYGSEDAEARSLISGKSYAILSVGGALYSFVSPNSDSDNLIRAVLHKSTDGGHSWLPTTVVFTAVTHDIALPGFLQFGKDYAGARDSYVYAYWMRLQSSSWGVQKPGEILLTRVPKTGIESLAQYQYFAGLDASGNPTWTASPSGMVPVFRDPNGVMIPSVSYHPGLGRYLLTTVHTSWSGGNFGVFDAPQPWGPWTTVRYYTGWPTGGQFERSSFYGNFSSKWMDTAGNGFVFVFTGISSLDAWNSVPGTFVLASPDTTQPDRIDDLRSSGP